MQGMMNNMQGMKSMIGIAGMAGNMAGIDMSQFRTMQSFEQSFMSQVRNPSFGINDKNIMNNLRHAAAVYAKNKFCNPSSVSAPSREIVKKIGNLPSIEDEESNEESIKNS